MVRSPITLLGLAVAASVVVTPLGASAQSEFSDRQREEIGSVVREYILKNPEIVMEAIELLRERKEMAEAAADRDTVAELRKEIFGDPDSPVGGNVDGDVTIVEFFDYRCGVCKRVHPIVAELIETDGKIRRIYKEWPILGPMSVTAARAAIAARQQGKYAVFHDALMELGGGLDEKKLFAAARSLGLDVDRLKRDMGRPEVDEQLRRTYALAEKLRLNGTPSFLIGDMLLRGGRDLQTMRALVAEARNADK